MAGKRRRYGAEFKAEVALEALKGELRSRSSWASGRARERNGCLSRVRPEATCALLRIQCGTLKSQQGRNSPDQAIGIDGLMVNLDTRKAPWDRAGVLPRREEEWYRALEERIGHGEHHLAAEVHVENRGADPVLARHQIQPGLDPGDGAEDDRLRGLQRHLEVHRDEEFVLDNKNPAVRESARGQSKYS